MKKLLLFLALGAFAMSCSSSDDGNNNTTENSIVGKWILESQIIEWEDGTINDYTVGCMVYETRVFAINTSDAGTSRTVNIYDYSGEDCSELETIVGNWVIDGDKLSYYIYGDIYLMNIKFNSNNSFTESYSDGSGLIKTTFIRFE